MFCWIEKIQLRNFPTDLDTLNSMAATRKTRNALKWGYPKIEQKQIIQTKSEDQKMGIIKRNGGGEGMGSGPFLRNKEGNNKRNGLFS